MTSGGAPAVETGLAALRAGIADYYTSKLRRFGATPPGVDWSCQATQQMRFVQLLRLCDFADRFQLDDLGCGYGALLDYLLWRHPSCAVDYLGIDLSAAMVRRARTMFRHHPGARFVIGHVSPRIADYSVASGIFNVQLDQPRAAWEGFIADTLQHLYGASRRGFAINFIACPGGGQTPRPGLYVTEPLPWAEYCASRFEATVEVIKDYGLREFSLLVRRRSVTVDSQCAPRPGLQQ